MSKSHVSRCLVFLLFSVMGTILALNPITGQVRFDEPVNLSPAGSDSWNPDIAAIDDQVFVFWHDQVPEISDILLAHSRDRGLTFRIWNLTRDYEIQHSVIPRVASDGKNIYVGWRGEGRVEDISTCALLIRIKRSR